MEEKKKIYDLEERTFKFAEKVKNFVNRLPKTVANIEYGKQLIRSSGSQASNYIEANESLGKKDFSFHIRICRKEAKESCLWLRLCETGNDVTLENERKALVQEGGELRRIFTAILEKSLIKS